MRWRCALLQRWLPEYPDVNLPAFWKRRLRAHVEGCAACRQELAKLAEVLEALKAAPVAEPGQDFWQEFSREMHLKLVQAAQTAPQPQRSKILYYWLGAPAVAVLVLWIGMQMLDLRHTPGTALGPQMAQKSGEPAAPQEKPGNAGPPPAAQVAQTKAQDQLLPVSMGSPTALEENGGADDDFTSWDPESALSELTDQEREILLKRLRLKAKDGSCVTLSSSVSWA